MTSEDLPSQAGGAGSRDDQMSEGSIDGFYSVFTTGAASSGLLMVILKDGVVAGADSLGGTIDGHYSWNEAESVFTGQVTVALNPGGAGLMTVQGAPVPPDGLRYETPIRLPRDFASQPFVRMETPLGPVNARFVKVRGF